MNVAAQFPDPDLLKLRAMCLHEALDRHTDDDKALKLAGRLLGFMLDGVAPAVRAVRMLSGPPRRRFTDTPALHPETVRGLPDGHPALVEARTLFPNMVVDPAEADRVLVSGVNNRKLGDRVSKGAWAGMPLFHLTLEERATCPSNCFNWSRCYGSGMQRARRHRHGPELETAIERDLAKLQNEYPGGFVVRLHTLGDFFSTQYVDRWVEWLVEFDALHVFGYTARETDSEIGRAIDQINREAPARWVIRRSSAEILPGGATTIFTMPDKANLPKHAIVCPAETGKTECCGSCGLCFAEAARDKTIVFIAHGPEHLSAEARDPKKLTENEAVTLAAVETMHVAGKRVTSSSLAHAMNKLPNTCLHALKALRAKGVIKKSGNRGDARWFPAGAALPPPRPPIRYVPLGVEAVEPHQEHDPLPPDARRRCEGCAQIFSPKYVDETKCEHCMMRGRAAA